MEFSVVALVDLSSERERLSTTLCCRRAICACRLMSRAVVACRRRRVSVGHGLPGRNCAGAGAVAATHWIVRVGGDQSPTIQSRFEHPCFGHESPHAPLWPYKPPQCPGWVFCLWAAEPERLANL